MAINLDFGKYTNYEVSESRLTLMLNGDKKSATQVSLWERFKDLFRTEKRGEAYIELYNFLYNTEGTDKLDAFNRLKNMVKPEHQKAFTQEICCDDLVFFIDGMRVGESSIQKLINVYEQTPLHPMSREEQRLFVDMLNTLREKEQIFDEESFKNIRELASSEHRSALLNHYRPQDDIYFEGVEWKPDVITKEDEEVLKTLNFGSMNSFTQFTLMGYQDTRDGVKFMMLHPSLKCLLGTYSREKTESDFITKISSAYVNMLNEAYANYHSNKQEIDSVLKKVYQAHGNTLNIFENGQNRNRLVAPPASAASIEMHMDDFAENFNESLNEIFNKWTDPHMQLTDNVWHVIHDTVL